MVPRTNRQNRGQGCLEGRAGKARCPQRRRPTCGSLLEGRSTLHRTLARRGPPLPPHPPNAPSPHQQPEWTDTSPHEETERHPFVTRHPPSRGARKQPCSQDTKGHLVSALPCPTPRCRQDQVRTRPCASVCRGSTRYGERTRGRTEPNPSDHTSILPSCSLPTYRGNQGCRPGPRRAALPSSGVTLPLFNAPWQHNNPPLQTTLMTFLS
ncbi:hypothetical protein B0T11DRAFT_20766 [Plectosphaerella cucumerina]|uniref:Uncharacterized protein n=1 Tax=Plectosphaerella cucumerina TaxID=40658 RepID=A0A8K0TVW8_9PEZI|nr:hypothetical protein B0T11DRAFT_20766 [Plectosphaerella cucumerina]